jgi:hypothetical protein
MSSIVLFTDEQTCSASGSSNPLLETGVLQNVLSYVGPGHCLFVAPVNKRWNDVYATVESKKLAYCDDSCNWRIITCVPQMTHYSSVFTSPSRVELSHKSGLDCTSAAYHHAAGMCADVASLATAHAMGMEYSKTVMDGAVQCNKLAEVQFLRSQGCPWSRGVLEVATIKGRFELVRWCYEQGCPWDSAKMAAYYAAQGGNVELMAWVLQQPGTAQLSEFVMSAAAKMGHTAMCKLLRAQQCPWDARSTTDAARGGHADVLRWLVSSGCPWNLELYRAAAKGGSVDVLTYVQQQGLLTSMRVLADMLDIAGQNNKLAAAKWLREQGAEWPTVFGWHTWSSEVIAWARAEVCTAD